MVLHGHQITEIDDLIAFIEETRGGDDILYNGDGSVAKQISYWDAAKTLLLAVSTYTYSAGPVPQAGVVTSILFDIYNQDGVTITKTIRYDITYNVGPVPPAGTVAGDVVVPVFP